MADPFAQYAVESEKAPAVKKKPDPFAQYAVPAKKGADPFAQYSSEPAQSESGYGEVQKTIERGFWKAPLVESEVTTDKELEAIAKHHGVDIAVVKDMATYAGAIREEGKRDKPGEIESSLARGVAFNVPQFIAKKTLDDPNLRNAFDDIQDLADKKRSFARGITENIVPIGAGARLVEKGLGEVGEAVAKQSLKRSMAEGAAIGGVASGARSREGEELKSVGLGVALGAPLGAGAELLGRGLGRLSGKASQAEREIAEEVIQRDAASIDKGTRDILDARQESESLLGDIISGRKDLDEASAKKILDEQLPQDVRDEYLSVASELNRVYRGENPENIHISLANDVIESRARDFAERLTGDRPKSLKDAQLAIKEYAGRQGAESTAQRYGVFVEEEAAKQYIRDKGIRETRGDNFMTKALNFISGGQFVLRDIDDRFGQKAEAAGREMSQNLNRMSFARGEARREADNIFRKNRSIDAELTKGDKVYQALDTGDTAGLSSQELNALQDIKKYLSNWHSYVNGVVKGKDPSILPLSIPFRENYVPHMLKDTDELSQAFRGKVDTVLREASTRYSRKVDDLSQLSSRELRDLSEVSPHLQEVLQGAQLLEKGAVRDGADLSAKLKDLFESNEGSLKLETMARAALERQDAVPDWMREKNLYKLMDKWTTNTLRHLYLRAPMDQLRSIARRVGAAGGKMEENYLNRLLQDMNGVRKGTFNTFTSQAKLKYNGMLDGLEKAYGPSAKPVVEFARAIPEVIADMNKQIYPNLLGLSPRALVMNATQLFTKTAPELGTAYGNATVLRAVAHFALNKSKQLARVREMGFQPAEFVQKYRQAAAEGVRRSSLYALPSNVISKAGDMTMMFYTKMDELNRGIALSVADMMAHDLGKGSSFAQSALKKMPGSVRKAVASAQSPDEVSRIIASHLNDSTQYNYSRPSMSEFGRTMGPYFSVFSKWPTSTAGEMIYEMRSKGLGKGAVRNAEKFIAPLALLQAADYLMLGENYLPWGEEKREKTDREKLIASKAGLSQAAPIGSIKGIVQGDFFSPPAVDALVKGIMIPALNGDQGKLKAGLSSAVQNYMPMSVFVRLFTDDLPTLVTGDRPEGSNFLERAETGIRKVGK